MGKFDWGGFLGPIAEFGLGQIGAHQDRQQRKGEIQTQKEQAQIDRDMQREFAQHGLRWRVEDAKAAGVSPLAALGFSGSSSSPVSIGDVSMPSASGDAFSNLGQNINRSIQATRTEEEKQIAQLQMESMKADVEGKTLDNQIRASKLRTMNQPGQVSFPGSDNFIPGQGNSGLVKVKPAERTSSQPGRLAQEAGWRPDVSFARTDTGMVPMIPEGLSESLEDDIIGSAMWRFRNNFIPNFSGEGSPPKSQLPKGATHWKWSYGKQEWQPAYGGSKKNWMDRAADWMIRNEHYTYQGGK